MEIDPKGRATLYTYDVRGRQTQVIQKAFGRLPTVEPRDQVEQTQYDNQGRPTQFERNGLVQWEKRYDRQGRMIGHRTSSWNQQAFFYDSLGRQDIVVANGHVFASIFDEWGRVVARLRDGDTLEVAKLGLDGSVLERRRPGSGAESLVYDAMGAVVRQSDSTGQSLTRILGAGGIDSLHLDALGNSKANIADFLGRTISTLDERGNVQRFGYDDHGELAWLEDNEGNRTRFETQRWESGEVRKSIKTIYPDGKTESVSYGPEGELLFRVDGNGIKTVNKYDRWGQLFEVTYQDAQGVPLADTTRFRYDNFGRRTHAQRGVDVDSTAYDRYGRVVGELQMIGGVTYRLSHSYPEGNRLRVTVLPDGSVVRRSVAEGFGVDSLWFGNNLVAGILYQQGRESSRTLSNGIQVNRVHDVGGRLSGLAYSKNGSALAGYGFGFDPVGNLSSIRRTHEAKGDEAMQYTADHQLGDWSRGTLNARDSMTAPVATQGWVLDSRGNWTGWSNGGIQESRLHSPANELLERRVGVVGTLQAWDNAGNLVSDGQRTYQWSHKGQLQSIAAGTTPYGHYTYDPLGRRTVKTAGGLTTISVYDGWQCIWQKVTGSGTDTTKTWVYGNYIDEPIAMVRSWGTSSDTLWYLQGNNYNVEALTDRTGAIVERYAYTPYGEPTVYTAAGTDGKWFTADDVTASVSAKGNALTFQGRELDAETGVYYFRNRYYSAQMGRFVSRDPIRYSKSLISLFRMELGNPFRFIDPDGKDPVYTQKKCVVTVSLKLTLAFSPNPEPDGNFGFLPPWTTETQNQFKSRVKSTAESFFNNQNYRCDKCCDCPSGASGRLSLSFGPGGTFIKVFDGVNADHRENSFEWSKRVVDWEKGTGGDPFSILIHEIGHLLGLGHPGDGPGVEPGSIEAYTADLSSIMGQGNQFREADFKKIFCSNLKCGK